MNSPLLASLLLTLAAAPAAPKDPPIQCLLNALDASERTRQHRLIEKIRSAVAARRELPRGFAFEVDVKKASISEIGEWIGLEARCCPFLHFTLDVAPGGAPIRVTLTGGANR